MTDDTSRRKNTGRPGNGGLFDGHHRTPGDVVLAAQNRLADTEHAITVIGERLPALTGDQEEALAAARADANEVDRDSAWFAIRLIEASDRTQATEDGRSGFGFDSTRRLAELVFDNEFDRIKLHFDTTDEHWSAINSAHDAAVALSYRDRIGEFPGWTQEKYDALTGPWAEAIGKVHPDDAD